MRVLLYRDLTAAQLAALQTDFPDCEFRVATTAGELARETDWPEVVFGNAPARLLQQATQLRWLQIVSSGFDEYAALQDHGVTVTTGQGLHAPIIARHVLMMILLFTRGQWHFARCQQEHRWDRKPLLPKPTEGQTVGLVGFGGVGQEVARLLQPLGYRILALKRQHSGAPPAGIDRVFLPEALDELLAESDQVVLSLPLTPETRGLFGADRFARFKAGAIFHNIARGSLVDESALLENLRNGKLGGAALDVFSDEPLAPNSPFWGLANVIVTPHIAGHHRELGAQVLQRFRVNLRSYLAGNSVAPAANFLRGY